MRQKLFAPRPQVSVVMPVRNGGALLCDAVRSLQAQSLRDHEVVLVDDGSTDGAVAAAQSLYAGCADGRLRVVAPGRHVGVARAGQLGVEAARAPLVARMDADDVAYPERLAAQRAVLLAQPRRVGVVGGLVRHLAGGCLDAGLRRYIAWHNGLRDGAAMARERLVESPLIHPATMMRRDVVLEAGGYRCTDETGWSEDYDLWLRLAQRGVGFAKLAQVVLGWRDGPGRLTRRATWCAAEAVWRCKVHYLAAWLRGFSNVVVWGAGPVGRRVARLLEAQPYGRRPLGFVDIDPRKVGGVCRGRPVVGPLGLADLLAGGGVAVVVAVGALGARVRIGAFLEKLGLRAGVDYLALA